MDAINQKLIKELGGSIPLEENPYEALGAHVGISEGDVIERLKKLKEDGQLKRISAILRHRKSGYTENAMVVLKVEKALIEEVGNELAQNPLVSHCYERTTYDKWPYNLYAMFHSKVKNEIQDFIQSFTEKKGINTYDILFSKEELKKTSMIYFDKS